jgi:4-phospho-D-threonate 3-dehydrogenase / 4-phospho-D-erythronate 3-dehydrogenase
MTNPTIAISAGDPAGIGAEVLAKALAAGALTDLCRPVVFGARWAFDAGARAAGMAPPSVEFVDVGVARPAEFRFGVVSDVCGRAAVLAVERAAECTAAGRAVAMVTCPINKESVHAAGYVNDIGHQEILARLTGAAWTATLLMTPGLKVVHLSTHKSLLEAARFVTTATIVEKLALTHTTLERWGMRRPRIAVAALNPHAGEGGLLGREELDEIAPAVAQARGQGIDARGPIPADSVFNRAIAGEFDVVLAMYHDQGHIAIKVHNFAESVTATLGIPFIRTSVDHGTAFDIAGRGTADPTSLIAAVRAAVTLATGRLGAGERLHAD